MFNIAENGKYYAVADTIRTGENLLSHIARYRANIVHLCETRKQAEETAAAWNETYKENKTNLY